ncbi:MAG: uroporphyrinogen-III C-methyltransferase [Burkholderiales bacterium]
MNANDGPRCGKVYLVGAGPGDPELLTLRAFRVLGLADVVLYDHLVNSEIVGLAPSGAQRIYVGKESSNHALPQHEINNLLVQFAECGHQVVRLKGGDPFIFGRGGEETEALALCGIPFEIVPGITAAAGAAAYAGIPLTHRDCAHACVLVTGHLKDGSLDLDWQALARPRQTIVIYMGLLTLPKICRELVTHGLPETTPAAAIQQGTTAAQRVVTGTLVTLPGRVSQEKLKTPTLIIIGEVARLHEQLAWFGASAGRLDPALAVQA